MLRTCLTLRSDYVRIPSSVRQTTEETSPLLFDNNVGTSREVAKVRFAYRLHFLFNHTQQATEIHKEKTLVMSHSSYVYGLSFRYRLLKKEHLFGLPLHLVGYWGK